MAVAGHGGRNSVDHLWYYPSAAVRDWDEVHTLRLDRGASEASQSCNKDTQSRALSVANFAGSQLLQWRCTRGCYGAVRAVPFCTAMSPVRSLDDVTLTDFLSTKSEEACWPSDWL